MRVETPAEKILYSTVLLETEGSMPHQRGAGTAFIFMMQEEGKQVPFLVTNKHVVEGTELGRFSFTKKKDDKPDVGERVSVEINGFEGRWYGHPDPEIDVAAMPLGPVLNQARDMGEDVFYSHVQPASIPTAAQLAHLDALEEVVFVGYPSGIYDRVNLLPVFRRGITATPLQIDHDGKPVFLVDASVFPGSSGSPVFIYNLGGYGTREGLCPGTRLFFLGVIAQVVYREDESILEFRSIPTTQTPIIRTKEMIDLGVVFKASTVVETVEGLLSVLKLEGSI